MDKKREMEAKRKKDASVSVAVLPSPLYHADVDLNNRNLTFIGKPRTVFFDALDCHITAFSLVNSSLTLVSFTIFGKSNENIAIAEDSILNLTDCNITLKALINSLLYGWRSQLILQKTRMNDAISFSSLIEGSPDARDPQMSLIVDDCFFENIVIKAQIPFLAGLDVQNVTVLNSRFRHITCTEQGQLPTYQDYDYGNRSVVMKSSHVWEVEGALSGGLVYGVQARYLTLEDMWWNHGTNAVRFSGIAAFSDDIDVNIVNSKFEDKTASEFWPNGGFLDLPHNTANINISNTTICGSSAPSGDGGFINLRGRSTIMINDSRVEDTYAGKCGGFVYAASPVDTVTLDHLSVRGSHAVADGGLLYLDSVPSFQALHCNITECHASKQGGAVFFNNSDNSTINFTLSSFWYCSAASGLGEDVLLSYQYVSNYNVSKKNFIKCTSDNTRNKVTFLPRVVHAEWTNSGWKASGSVITGISVGVSVLIAACVFLICLCCCCGCCVTCGCGRKKANAYQHVESQQTASFVPAKLSSDDYAQQQMGVSLCINN
ncbi:hypothetical protein BLNAU_12454 [Blattamonas nauphoetae]|uniref:Right handed beta helix domain-containing protein n=1 Tax=Blattamonas nauphoetae TaxID=2049346 RepID=A0ABQ9XJM1_9EUKA|nr:hypothetical protein BLNAU_12454 [Blattamonas nauphoetae]